MKERQENEHIQQIEQKFWQDIQSFGYTPSDKVGIESESFISFVCSKRSSMYFYKSCTLSVKTELQLVQPICHTFPYVVFDIAVFIIYIPPVKYSLVLRGTGNR